jgi:hypothetical protein
MEDIATDMERFADCVAKMVATASPKRGGCAGDTEQIVRNASTISVTNAVRKDRKDANSMQQKEVCVECIPDQNAVRKDASTMP